MYKTNHTENQENQEFSENEIQYNLEPRTRVKFVPNPNNAYLNRQTVEKKDIIIKNLLDMQY